MSRRADRTAARTADWTMLALPRGTLRCRSGHLIQADLAVWGAPADRGVAAKPTNQIKETKRVLK